MKWWTAIKGFAANEFASDAPVIEAWARAEVCAECPSLRVYSENDVYKELPPGASMLWHAPPRSGWCGEPAEDTGETCGCLVLAETPDTTTPITVRGVPMEPAGKTTKAAFTCPQRKWGRVPPNTGTQNAV